jgi:drug/metabolite transporter (DMT)-like permease
MPIFIAIMGYFFLREKLEVSEIIVLIICFGGVAVLILGGTASSKDSAKETSAILATVMLLLVPILNASGSIALRKLRNLHDYTTSAYLGFAMTLVFGIIVTSTGKCLNFVEHFGIFSWILTFISATAGVFSSVFRFKALQYETASKLAVFNYF